MIPPGGQFRNFFLPHVFPRPPLLLASSLANAELTAGSSLHRQGRVFKPSSKTKLSSYEEGEFDRMGGGFMVENQMMANSAF